MADKKKKSFFKEDNSVKEESKPLDEKIEEGKNLTVTDSKQFSAKSINVNPKKDWILTDGNTQYQMKQGTSIDIPEKFKSSLETEEVI